MPAGERESLVHVDRIQISDLELGRGSSRTAFIERITKVTVVGRVATSEPESEPKPESESAAE
ncbi:MAG TPA: hypothetical protein ENK31_06055 [Nannocystis exedens]|nr:hypothetical protein [Nannocystis exedens]